MDEQAKFEAFERLLSGQPRVAVDPEMDELASLARALHRAGAAARRAVPALDPSFRAGLRTQLLEEAAGVVPLGLRRRVRASVAARDQRMSRSLRSVLAIAAAALVMLVGGSLVALAQNAVPGDALYGLKIAREDLALHAVFGRVPKATRQMALARERLSEIKTMLQRGVRQQELYRRPLGDMDGRTLDATRLLIVEYRATKRSSVLAPLERFANAQKQSLESIVDDLPPGARPDARSAIEVLDAVTSRVSNVLAGCPCPADVLVPPANATKGTPGAVTCSCQAAGSTRQSTPEPRTEAQSTTPPPSQHQQPQPKPQPQPSSPGITVNPGAIDQQVNTTINGLLQDLGVQPLPLPTVPSSPISIPLPQLP